MAHLPTPLHQPLHTPFTRDTALCVRLLRKTVIHMRSRLLLPCWHAWNDLTQTAKITRAAEQARLVEEEQRARRASTSSMSINMSLLDNFASFS